MQLDQEHLRIATETDDDFFFLAWPLKIVHRIDDASPLWELSPEALLVSGFEIIVVLEACCEATGATTQVPYRSVHLPIFIDRVNTLVASVCRCVLLSVGALLFSKKV